MPTEAARKSILTALAVIVLYVGTGSAQTPQPAATANLSFTNGSFETSATGFTGGGALGASSVNMPGWVTTLGYGTNANAYSAKTGGAQNWVPSAQNGSYCVQLDGSQSNTDAGFKTDGGTSTPNRTAISQTFMMAKGTYLLSFFINNEVGTNKGGTSGVLVNFSGGGMTSTTGALSNQEYTVTTASGGSNTGWKQITQSFTVSDNTTPVFLSFSDDPNTSYANYTNSSNIAIDNVTVPEPRTVLGGMALVLVGAYRWWRRSQIAVA